MHARMIAERGRAKQHVHRFTHVRRVIIQHAEHHFQLLFLKHHVLRDLRHGNDRIQPHLQKEERKESCVSD
jgi:hypothetical protein